MDDRVQTNRTWYRWPLLIFGLITTGFLWPYDPVGSSVYWLDSAWLLGWLTALVLIGAAIGYVQRNPWSMLIVPGGLYLGGAISWFHFEHGWHLPDWPEFGAVSIAAFAVLLATAGASAGIACRVEKADEHAPRQLRNNIRLPAAVAGMLGLLAATTLVLFPLPYLGTLLAVGALLSGVAALQEDMPNRKERLLAVAGISLGLAIVATQIYAIIELVRTQF